MLSKREVATPPLPKNWKRGVRSAVLNVISLAQFSIAYARGWAANSINARVRLKAENDRLREEVALLREEMRIKDSRMTRIVPQRRPHYAPTERMAILELRADRDPEARCIEKLQQRLRLRKGTFQLRKQPLLRSPVNEYRQHNPSDTAYFADRWRLELVRHAKYGAEVSLDQHSGLC